MLFTTCIRFFGLIDVISFVCFFYSGFVEHSGLSGYIQYQITLAESFGSSFFSLVWAVGLLFFFSTFFSGVLMLMGSKYGVYFSLAQAPFRLTLVIAPSFALLLQFPGFSMLGLLGVVVVLSLELLKVIIQVNWIFKCR